MDRQILHRNFYTLSLEEPIITPPTSVIKFMRLFNILFVIQNNKVLFNKIYNDLENTFKIYLSSNINDYKIKNNGRSNEKYLHKTKTEKNK